MELATKEDFEALKKQVETLQLCVATISKNLHTSDILYISDIAKIEDLSISGIKKNPWLLPDFGVSEYPEGRCRWTLDKVIKWRAIPVDTRISMWRQRMNNRLKEYKGV